MGNDIFAGIVGIISLVIIIFLVVVAILAFLMPIFLYNIWNEMRKLNAIVTEGILPKMLKLDKNLELTTKLVADMRKRIAEK